MTLKYIASSGNQYVLNTNGSLVKSANFHAWEWGAIGTELQYGMRVSNFKREPATYTAVLVVYGPYTKRKAFLDALHEDFENDVRNKTPGRIVWSDWYIDGYVTKSTTAPDTAHTRTDNEIEIFCPYPFWIREQYKRFYRGDPLNDPDDFDYPYDYPYEYLMPIRTSARWLTKFPFSSEFLMTIYGAATNPKVTINGYPYQVNVTLDAGEYLIIDSRHNTITQYLTNGQTLNIFDLRDKANSVFEPIPGGTLTLTWSGAFGYDITLFNERSEPRWSS